MNRNNIFIIHTVFQRLSADIIVENFIGEDYNNIAILISDGNFDTSLRSDKWSEVIEINGSNINRWTGLSPWRVQKIYKDIIAKYSEYNLYVANVNYPISNTFYKNAIKYNFDIYGFPEGLANIIDEEKTVKRDFKQILKFIGGLFLLNPFYIYGNNYSGDRLKSKFEIESIIKILKKGNTDKNNKTDKCLYLSGLKSNDDTIRKLCARTNISEKNIEVKPHPRSKNKINDFTLNVSNVSAEELFIENNYATVLGEGSSALYNIKCISPETEVICFRFDDEKSERVNNIDNLFIENNIKVIRV